MPLNITPHAPIHQIGKHDLEILSDRIDSLRTHMGKRGPSFLQRLGKTERTAYKVSGYHPDRIYISTGKLGPRVDLGNHRVLDQAYDSSTMQACSILRALPADGYRFSTSEKDQISRELLAVPDHKFNLSYGSYDGKHQGKSCRKFELVMPHIKGKLSDIQSELEFKQKVYIAQDLTQCLSKLHQARVAHRNIHSGACLVFEDEKQLTRARLSELQHSSTGICRQHFLNPQGYSAPEKTLRILDKHRLPEDCSEAEKSDMFSLGLVLYKLFSGKDHPFTKTYDWSLKEFERIESYLLSHELKTWNFGPMSHTLSSFDQMNSAKQSEFNDIAQQALDSAPSCIRDQDLAQFIKSMTSFNPAQRPDVEEAKIFFLKL